MRNLVRFALIGVISLVAGCGGTHAPVVPLDATRAGSTNYSVVYSFGNAPDGANPIGNLVYSDGTLYGATNSGGSYDCSSGTGYLFGCGTAFGVTTSGKEVMLHAFTIGNGAEPVSGLISATGTFYGTTTLGGSRRGGTVYSITPTGTESVLFNFDRRDLSAHIPTTELIDVGGLLYGTTVQGGKLRHGTVFSLTMAGKLRVLYHFRGGSDGADPSGRLLDVNGTLYGTTFGGGAQCGKRTYQQGCGTVYSITRNGVEKVLYVFKGGTDGATPRGRLLDVHGTLYGATVKGGRDKGRRNNGTIYGITTTGKEKVLYAFTGGADGASPNGALIEVHGSLYGTTKGGGAYLHGTVFSVTLSGTETVLHSFAGPPDGAAPGAGLTDVGSTLYGTTISGGSPPCRYTTYSHQYRYCGTIFALTLSP